MTSTSSNSVEPTVPVVGQVAPDFALKDQQGRSVSLSDYNGIKNVVVVFFPRAFADAEGYFFPMLSDYWPHGGTAQAYGVFDQSGGFATRGTFLIDRDGVVRWTLINGPSQKRDFAGYRAALLGLSGSVV